MNADFTIDTARQRYLDILHRFLQGRIAIAELCVRWREEREAIWRHVWAAAAAQRCSEREQLLSGEAPPSASTDPRRLPRMLDRCCSLPRKRGEEEAFRSSVADLLAAYRNYGSTSQAAGTIDYPQRIHLFERPPLTGCRHPYPCTLQDIRLQLALVPEYDLEGLWAIGLASLNRSDDRAYGTYYRWFYPIRKPVILLHSTRGTGRWVMRKRDDPGYLEQRLRVEESYGLRIERKSGKTVCRWSPEDLRRYVVEHVLLHEIGHHVQYQQRWRAGFRSWLPTRQKEQFAEDYAIRFNRDRL